jgi:hypothetical protein
MNKREAILATAFTHTLVFSMLLLVWTLGVGIQLDQT